ncbi:hypothetical protein KsCSTR_14100 [Candidatus Kuenenia stuttgartiensis]|uniref:Uncharacterized protein n=1 Tax=Kuenenia stuttgartiensis TaxID=174633 RepID=Q1Q173_KUEST|nr:hypothetical protein KsCSTR_14100 [Candidatus Kuenenia stuttgartiensis]CAJ73758.1 unknown protein [Candidatus Kuenenia stuttgartiensis]
MSRCPKYLATSGGWRLMASNLPARYLPLPYYTSSNRSLPYGLVLADSKIFPNLLCTTLFTCRHPYPDRFTDCFWLLLHQ